MRRAKAQAKLIGKSERRVVEYDRRDDVGEAVVGKETRLYVHTRLAVGRMEMGKLWSGI